MQERQIMNHEDVRRALARVAHEILERNRGAEGLVIVGIHTRGVHLARRIAANLAEFEGIEVPVATLDVSLYRDDNRVRSQSHTKLQPTDIPMGIQGKRVVLVDDVLYTGRTIRAAMDALVDFGLAGRSRSSWPSCWTGATGSCPSGPTTLARTSPPPSTNA